LYKLREKRGDSKHGTDSPNMWGQKGKWGENERSVGKIYGPSEA